MDQHHNTPKLEEKENQLQNSFMSLKL